MKICIMPIFMPERVSGSEMKSWNFPLLWKIIFTRFKLNSAIGPIARAVIETELFDIR